MRPWLWLLGAAMLAGTLGFALRRSEPGLPYTDHFTQGSMAEWKTYGGAWQVSNGAITNDSDDTGSKVLTNDGSEHDMVLESDVKLTNHFGDAGVIVRVTDAEEGTNAFNGYYVGLRLPDQLLLSRMDFGFVPLARTPVQGGVQAGVWYHLRVNVRGCVLDAEARDERGRLLAQASAHDDSQCLARGAFGLRSFAAGGSWRNVRARVSP